MIIKKRDNSTEKFDINKIINAVDKAYKACGKDGIPQEVTNILKLIPWKSYKTVEEIQDHVEDSLMQIDTKVAKAFILYREKHKQLRDNVARNLNFIDNFIASDNTANATIDDNGNVATHNVAVMNTEIHKQENKETNVRIWYNKIKELYGEKTAKQFLTDIETIAYPHDISSQIGMPYCVAITMYPFLLHGIKDIGGLSAAPKNIDSFCGLFVNLVFAVAAQYKGAVATPGMLLCMDYFLRKNGEITII